jgi:hypothetical protein
LRLDAGSAPWFASIVAVILFLIWAARMFSVAAFFVKLFSGRISLRRFRDRDHR